MPNFTDGIWNRLFSDTYEEGNRHAFVQMRTAAGGNPMFLSRLIGLPEKIAPSPTDELVLSIFNEGFEKVSAKISQFFQGEALEVLVDGFEKGLDTMNIARNLHKRVSQSRSLACIGHTGCGSLRT